MSLLAKAVLEAQDHHRNREITGDDANSLRSQKSTEQIPSGVNTPSRSVNTDDRKPHSTKSPPQSTPASLSRNNTLPVAEEGEGADVDDVDAPRFVRNESNFRGPLQVSDKPGSSSRKDYRGKRRDSSATSETDGLWKRWVEVPLGLAETPGTKTPIRSESPANDAPERPTDARQHSDEINFHQAMPKHSLGTPASEKSNNATWETTVRRLGLKKHRSLPHMSHTPEDHEEPSTLPGDREEEASSKPPGNPRLASRRWALLKNRFAPQSHGGPGAQATAAVSPDVNISDELLSGGLATLMLKMHFERDEQDHRRVPVLLHHLKIRVSDSIHPLNGTHAVFRIEV